MRLLHRQATVQESDEATSPQATDHATPALQAQARPAQEEHLPVLRVCLVGLIGIGVTRTRGTKSPGENGWFWEIFMCVGKSGDFDLCHVAKDCVVGAGQVCMAGLAVWLVARTCRYCSVCPVKDIWHAGRHSRGGPGGALAPPGRPSTIDLEAGGRHSGGSRGAETLWFGHKLGGSRGGFSPPG